MSSYHHQKEGNSFRSITCHSCGKEVPTGNLLMHQLRACSGTDQTRGEFPGPQSDAMDVDEPHLGTLPVMVFHNPEVIITSIDDSSIDDSSTTSDVQVVQGPSAGRIRNGDDEVSLQQSPQSQPDDPPLPSRGGWRRRRVEVVDLVDSVVSPPSASSASMLFGQVDNHWTCPVCTLHNPASVQQCNACNSPNPDGTLCPTQTEEHPMNTHSSITSPRPMLGGGVLMGGNLGVLGSFTHGQDPFASAMEGIVGGEFWSDAVSPRQVPGRVHIYRNERMVHPNRMGLAQARTSGSMSGGYPSMEEDFSENHHGRTRPRSSFRVDSERGQDGSIITLVTDGRSSTTIRQSQSPIGMNDHMRQYLLHAMLDEHTTSRDGDLDSMGYDEMLQTFGDGTENLGANEGQINSLPSQIIQDPQRELPEDARCCLICLDGIEKGEMRKILPCLHAFHAHCCDKWLKTNGSCPICKHRL